MYETRVDIFNKFKDEKRVKDICNNLNSVVSKIIGTNPKFTYFVSKEDSYFTIYNENKYDKCISIYLNFRLHYPDKDSFTYDKEAKNLNDEEYNKYIECKYNQSKLFCAEIQWISINPERKRFGTKVVKELIDTLKIIESIEMILLHPQDRDAKDFWIKNKFKDNDTNDKRLNSYISDDMIYKY